MEHGMDNDATVFLAESIPVKKWGPVCMKTNETCNHGHSNRLCEAVSRAMWGCESLAELLRFKVLQELEENAEWYAQRVVGAHFLVQTCAI
jgi:hypothetical protein